MRTTPCANSAYADPSPSPVSSTCRKFVMTHSPIWHAVAARGSRGGLRVVLVPFELLADVQQLLVDDELLPVPLHVVVPGVRDPREEATEDVAGLVRGPRRHQTERVDSGRSVHRLGHRLAGDGVRIGGVLHDRLEVP